MNNPTTRSLIHSLVHLFLIVLAARCCSAYFVPAGSTACLNGAVLMRDDQGGDSMGFSVPAGVPVKVLEAPTKPVTFENGYGRLEQATFTKINWNGHVGWVVQRVMRTCTRAEKGASSSSSSSSSGCSATTAVNVRGYPSRDGAYLSTITAGYSVTVLGKQGDWTNIAWPGRSNGAWVFSAYIACGQLRAVSDSASSSASSGSRAGLVAAVVILAVIAAVALIALTVLLVIRLRQSQNNNNDKQVPLIPTNN